MEEGRLTDNMGRHVDFKNTIVIMTSNIGAQRISSGGTFCFMSKTDENDYGKMKDTLKGELERELRPEFINRLDEIIVFRKLIRADLLKIVELELDAVSKRLVEKGLKLEVSTEAKEFLVDKGFDEKFGARPLRRAVSEYLEDPLSEALLRGEFADGVVKVDVIEEDGKRLSLTSDAGDRCLST
jgi:ATP-dependent Clp protease ATP-binding subunit ClpC